jgi:hypothetical protein
MIASFLSKRSFISTEMTPGTMNARRRVILSQLRCSASALVGFCRHRLRSNLRKNASMNAFNSARRDILRTGILNAPDRGLKSPAHFTSLH